MPDYVKKIAVLLLCFVPATMLAGQTSDTNLEIIKTGNTTDLKKAVIANTHLVDTRFGDNDETLLMIAIENNRDTDFITFMLKCGFNPDDKAKDKRTPLMFAAQYSTDIALIKQIITYGTVFNFGQKKRVLAQDAEGHTAFFYAKQAHNDTIYNGLLVYAPDPEYTIEQDKSVSSSETNSISDDNSGSTTDLQKSAKNEKENTVPIPDKPVSTPAVTDNIQTSVIERYSPEYLFEKTATIPNSAEIPSTHILIQNPDNPDGTGKTALMSAAAAGNDWDISNLLSSGADINKKDQDGWTPLMYAIRYQNDFLIVKMLIDHGSSLDVVNKYGNTPLQIAAQYSNNPDILAYLLKSKNKAEPDVWKAFILTLINTASSSEIERAKIKVFLNMNIELNRTYFGKTPLTYAVETAHSTTIAGYLLENGARADIKDVKGHTSFYYARINMYLPHDSVYWSLNTSVY